MFDLVEEPFDLTTGAVELRTEADWIAAIDFRRDVGLATLLHCKLSNPTGDMAAVGKQHCPGMHTKQQFNGKSNVTGLTGAQRPPYRPAIAIDHFARQAAA
jgi:hypothetical protein